eukprot:12857073-Prorocentrum_lima.AAC.1
MTSSLVGSEMCIRDRLIMLEADGKANENRKSTWKFEGLALGNAAVGDAVSYTHLTLPTICSV